MTSSDKLMTRPDCEAACPLVTFCNNEIEKRREEIAAIGMSTLGAAERYESTLQRYIEGRERLQELGGTFGEYFERPEAAQAAAALEAHLPKLRENAAGWIDTKHRRLESLEAFKQNAKSTCHGPLSRKKYIILGEKVTRCSARYNKLHFLTFRAISHLPRDFPADFHD